MKITTDQLTKEVGLARKSGWLPIFARAEKRHGLPAGVLLAIASRETDMRDIVGDGGHGRGLFQIDDRSHSDFLTKQGAAGPGGKPPISAAADYAAGLLASNLAFGKSKRVGANQLLKFACSAYNAGPGNAWSGFQGGDSDKRTAGGDYGDDVLARLAAIQSRNGGGSSSTGAGGRILKKGDRGDDVAQLKVDLQAWFDREAPGVWPTFKIKPGPLFGAVVETAVRDFQMRNGLDVDGEVGEATRKILAKARVPAPKPKPKPTPQPSPGDRILKQGDRGPDVTRLKRDLEAWFERASPGVWASFEIKGGPAFGPGLDRAMREFQRRNGLLIDGEVGEETLGAIHGAAPSPRPTPTPKPGPRANVPDLTLDGPKKVGSEGVKVRLIQGWLSLHGFKLVVDGGYGKATARQVRAFQTAKGLPVTGVVDDATYAKLVHPLVVALSPIAGGRPLGQLVVAYARQHLAQHPQEAGGENRGPWVRLYTEGQEGVSFPWCAGFATFILEQASLAAGVAMPIPRTLACDAMQASSGARFLPQPKPSQRARVTPGSFFLRIAAAGAGLRYAHTGIVVEADADSFKSIEGNTNDENSAEGFEVCARVHGYQGLDFIVI